MSKSTENQLAKLLRETGQDKDDWMARALFLAQALARKGVDTQPILTISREKIYPFLTLGFPIGETKEPMEPKTGPANSVDDMLEMIETEKQLKRLHKMPVGFRLMVASAFPGGEYRIGYEYKDITTYVPGSGSYYTFPEALKRCLDAFYENHINYDSGDMTDER